MKKNISINISGIIFHIEEDGYETLKHYLDSISKYFSSYEDSDEIIADIEGRIAEIFLEKLQDGNQIVSFEDVNSLIKTMGSISDFEAIEEEGDLEPAPIIKETAQKKEKTTKQSSSTDSGETGHKKTGRLYRDLQRKILGGVASGIAHYYNFDPLWLRIGILIVTFGLAFAGPLSAIVLIGYFIMWAVTPGNDQLEENKNLKKFYRDPDQKVLGGVSSGLANYLNVDTMVIRIIFLVLLFGFGSGLVIYIVLWIITPMANSLTDKMQMKGEAVTLSNIDTNYKKSKTIDLEPKGEGVFTKVLLFPFRLIGKIFVGMGRAFAPLMLFLVAVIRVVTGAIITTTALSIMVSLLVATGVFLGLYNGDWFLWDSDLAYFPIEMFRNTVPEIGLVFLFVTSFIPVLYLFIAGITIIAKRRIMSPAVGWSILGIWFIAILGTFATLPNVVRDFRDEGIYRVADDFEIAADTVRLNVNEVQYGYFTRRGYRWNSDSYRETYNSDFTDLDIRMSDSDKFRVEKRFRARGRSLDDAEKRAQELTYEYKVEGSTVTFDSEMKFPEKVEFRAQEADITLYVPEGRPFKINEGMRSIMEYFKYGYSWRQAYNNTWVFRDGDLLCLTCELKEETSSNSAQSNNQQFNLDEFSVLKLSSSFKVNIIQGDEYKMEVSSKERFDTPSFRVINDELSLSRVDFKLNEEETSNMEITITVPQLNRIRASDNVDLNINGFNSERMTVRAFDNAIVNLNSTFDELELFLTDEARVNLLNKTNKLEALLFKSSRLYGYEANVEIAEIETDNESRVRINVNQELNVIAKGFSSVSHKGNAQINIKDKSRSATITKY